MAYLLTFSLSLLFFHTSEFFLALLFHGPSKVSTRCEYSSSSLHSCTVFLLLLMHSLILNCVHFSTVLLFPPHTSFFSILWPFSSSLSFLYLPTTLMTFSILLFCLIQRENMYPPKCIPYLNFWSVNAFSLYSLEVVP